MTHYTSLSSRVSINSIARLFVISLLAMSLLLSPFVRADTAPPSGTPATVSADPLPTVQINGIVWKQAVSGNTVYAVGRFTQARPAGVAVGGAGSVTRNGILAYDIRTGVLSTGFVHSITGGKADVRAVAVSPDGTRLYVGGSFTTVDGQARSNFAVFNLTTNQLISGSAGTNGTVKGLAASNTQVYVGGAFSAAGGQTRKMVAAYNNNGAINTSWKADVTGASGSHVDALAVASAQGNLIIGGSFNAINGSTYYSIGAVKLASGANVTPWASKSASFPIRMQAPVGTSATSSGITSLSYDGTQVYLTAFTYISGARPGTFEGRAAINPATGALIWLNDCVGDSYDAYPIGKVLYSVNHSHSCKVIGGFTQQAAWRALAETTYKTQTNVGSNGGNYPSLAGQPASTLLNWFPTLNTANVSGSSQAAWSVVGTTSYVALGGEFTRANNVAQQGLVRYATKTLAPNKLGPMSYPAGLALMPYAADSKGTSLVRVFVTGDPDNGLLTYEVYRRGGTTPVATKTVDSRYWRGTSWTFNDTGIPIGTSQEYTLKVKDTFGNTLSVSTPTVINDTDARIAYSGKWVNSQNHADGRNDFARGMHHTTVNGASYSYSFFGSSVKIIGEKAYNRGKYAVSIDGGAATTVNAYDAAVLYQQTLFSKTGLGFGRHTIKVTKISGGYMDVDAIQAPVEAVVNDTSGAAVYQGVWTSRQNTAADVNEYGKGVHYTKVNGASVTVKFRGTSVALLDSLVSSHGNIGVSIDGGAEQTISSYSKTTKHWKIIFQKSGLSSGSHTIKLTKRSGTYMNFDAIFVR